jgi:hypothetical protein
MSDEISAIEKSVEEILIDLMAKKVMSVGIQALSTRRVQAYPFDYSWIWTIPSCDRVTNEAS